MFYKINGGEGGTNMKSYRPLVLFPGEVGKSIHP